MIITLPRSSAEVSGRTMLVVMPFYTYRTYLLYTRISVGDKVGGYQVSRDDRNFWFGNVPLQVASQAAIDELDLLSTPGERLLVGPADLSRTIYSDVVFYFMFPELEPATYFIEMDPGLANRAGNGLATDISNADWVLQTRFWDDWDEPNDSANPGDPLPNEVLKEKFCVVGEWDTVVLSERCR